ncbi:MAG: bifunctional DNA-formamidopyrimidine glycosylase/DNA-(apurinic or apyrimidinic site) lyase [Deltaproteobacteria bacterium]|jgi:formamidopyrimidine-DNA glycosylase|nr:bifunctional DNA-formamidopyrimidine glycosylase/DNA-(apurinic or apyrimidinic site) lyase [Deltaproteobacteria bacterium]MBW2530169.1 bifunctional DNA-formamidopyrimidine glycosylase/DNA-(apurinic or apyrimidinic site) lyase [Deltaproteobacteria bacterium]
MPELPEVETVRRQLEPWLVGRTIRSARLLNGASGPKYADLVSARGGRILGVDRRGKFLLLPLSGSRELVVHLGMTGTISDGRGGGHVRVVLDLSGPPPRRLHFHDPRRFGRFLVVPAGDYSSLPTLLRMGPEPLDAAFSLEAFTEALGSRSSIKAHLLSQRPVAGLGNIYVDEALWRARIDPRRRSVTLSRRKAAALRRAIRAVLRESIAAKGTTLLDYRTVDGETGLFRQRLNVYGHGAEPCPRCGRAIAKIQLAGRGTHLCTRCQR